MSFLNLFVPAFLAALPLFGANGVGLNINDEDVELHASYTLRQLSNYATGTDYVLSAHYLHAQNGKLLGISFGGYNTVATVMGLQMGIGIKAVAADNFFALPIFLLARYTLPTPAAVPRSFFHAYWAYSPKVLSFNEAKNYNELRFELDTEAISNVHIYGGYRMIDTDYTTFDKTLNDSWYAGLRLTF